ncbi:phage tail tape measure protein [Sphingosinicella sp. BN140058]|uniref:phage tail tape measure protein n=1 Tax=Sphingosinicella sp. BN140058 TaxID=1892855 RepID=UPI00101188B4|nr:phage tail tape measure protein [Sphingosinicella sp. BN140058]QAY77926.1 phage tail tape measure protein [Sphingosinicella sp. BN140058]
MAGEGNGVVLGFLKYVLGFDSLAFEEGADQAQKRLNKVQRNLQQTAEKFTNIGATMSIGITAPLTLFGVKSVNAASDAAELQSAFDQTFGAMSAQMTEWARVTGDAMGRSTQEIQGAANTFGMFFNQAAPTKKAAAELSQQFAVLAQDLSSFFNTSPDEAMNKLRSGLSGESEPLRDFGVFLSDAAVQAKALEMGLKGVNNPLTEQEKILARANVIMEQTKTAQGDVARTSSGTANQIRAAQAAWEELSITFGTKLLPVITPLVGIAADLLNAFSGLSPQVQSFAVGAAAVAAALGPILVGVGGLINVGATLLPMVGGWATSFGAAATAAGGVGAVLVPLLPIVAAMAAAAAAAYLAWKNWDTIGPMLSELWSTISAALGPPLIHLFDTVKQTLSELWNGPFGEGVRQAAKLWLQFEVATVKAVGPVALALLRGFITTIGEVFAQVGRILNVAAALLKGDFSGAWEGAKAVVTNVVTGIGRVIESMVPGAIAAVTALYNGVKTWISDKLNAIFESAKAKIQSVGDKFKWLWDVVVGHSYIPDMVDAIGVHMARLDGLMVQPVTKATGAAGAAFRELQATAGGIFERLFPEQARYNQYLTDMKALEAYANAAKMPVDQLAEAMRRLHKEYVGLAPNDQPELPQLEGLIDPDRLGTIAVGGDLDRILDQVANKSLPDFSKSALEHTGEVALGFAHMAESVAGSISDMVSAFKAGNIWDKIAGVADMIGTVIKGVQGFGGFGGPQTSFGGFRAAGGPTVPGKSYVVGENGPEWFTPGARGFVTPNNDNGRRSRVEIVPSPYFTAVVDGRAESVAAPLAARAEMGGAARARVSSLQQQRRRLP